MRRNSGMIERPKFKDKYVVRTVGGDGTFLLSETSNHIVYGAAVEAVSPLLDGSHTRDEIVSRLAHAFASDQVNAALAMLEREGYLQEQPRHDLPLELSAFWTELGIQVSDLSRLLSSVRVKICGIGSTCTERFARRLQSLGFALTDQPNFIFVVCDDYEDPCIAEINAHCLRAKIPWMIFKPAGVNTWVGPIFVPDRTACWACLQSRLTRNRVVEAYVRRRHGDEGPFFTSRARLRIIEEQAYSTAIAQFLRLLATGANASLESRIAVTEIISMRQSFHTVIRRPQCRSCGEPDRYRIDGFDLASMRLEPEHIPAAIPDRTFAALADQISEVMGVVGGVGPCAADGPVRIFSASHNFVLSSQNLQMLRDGLGDQSFGSGSTEGQGQTAALCEAIERFCGVFSGEETRIETSLHELGDRGIDPNECMLFSARQFEERDAWLARRSKFQVVPRRLDPAARFDWSPVRSFVTGDIKYLPTAYLYYGYPTPAEKFFCWADSNGNAAGATMQEALLNATLELVERDAVCVWWYNRVSRPAVDLEGLDDPIIHRLRSFYGERDRELWVLDLTHDLGIPVFAAVTRRVLGPTEDIVMGFGAHLDRHRAICRALLEMNQFATAVREIGVDKTTQYGWNDPEAIQWWRHARVESETYLLPNAATRAEQSISVDPASSPATLLQTCFGILRRAGHDILLLDQTRPDVGLPVAKVMVPGLRHFWARYAPGRLYDVPVKLGWVDRKRSEEELNPTTMFL
jgi:oxazoline/thiazoline synthase